MRKVWALVMMLSAAASGQDYRDSLLSVVLEGQKVDSPRIAATREGRLVVCARQLEPGPATTRVWASEDRGLTWEMVHDFERNWYGPSFFQVGGDLYLFLLGPMEPGESRGLALGKSPDGGRTWRLETIFAADEVSQVVTTGNAPVLVTREFLIAAVADKGGTGEAFPQSSRVGCGWCRTTDDPMAPENWTWTPFLEMPDPNRAPRDKGGWLEPNPVIAPGGDLLLLVRVDSEDGELGAVVRVDMEHRMLEFEDRFPAEPGQTGFIRMPGGGNGMFFAEYDPASRRYLCAANPRTGGARLLWGHTRIRNCLALFESDDLYHWTWVRALIRDDQDHDWSASARHAGFQQPSWAIVGDDLYAVSRTAYGETRNWHDANRISVHRLSDYRRYLDSDGEVARYAFDRADDLGYDSSRQGGAKADARGVAYDADGHSGGCARFDGEGFLDLRYRVGSEFHYAEAVTVAAWVRADSPDGRILDFPINKTDSGLSVALAGGRLEVGARSCQTDPWQAAHFPFPAPGRWVHAVVEIDFARGRARVWIDGEEAAPERQFRAGRPLEWIDASDALLRGEMRFGESFYKRHLPSVTDVVGKSHGGGAAFVGRLDDLRFFRRALSASERESLLQ